jgi:hypothetical protein
MMVSSGGNVACTTKGPEKEPAPAESPSTVSQSPQSQGGTPSDSGSIWDNMPLSFRKSAVGTGSQSIPAQPSEWSNTEWRYYQSPDALPTLRNYFRSEMPRNGWDQEEWVDDGDSSLSLWTSNSGADRAMVWMEPEGQGTFIALARSTR